MTTKRTPSTQAPEASVAPSGGSPTGSTASTGDTSSDEHIDRPALFPLGRVVATPGAIEFMERLAISAAALLEMHQSGEWDDLCAEGLRENLLALRRGLRLFSVYRYGPAQEALWVITEADRSATTILLPSEY